MLRATDGLAALTCATAIGEESRFHFSIIRENIFLWVEDVNACIRQLISGLRVISSRLTTAVL
jgi:hypothetical protein